MVQPLKPTFDGFVAYIRTVVCIPESAVADDSPWLTASYVAGLEWVNTGMGLERLPLIYTTTVYNAGTSILINHAPDIPPSTYFADARKKFGIGKAVNGLMTTAADQGTSGSTVISDAMSNLSLADLMMMQDPWGRQVIAVLMEQGPQWGYTP
ncbi:hypothetical protein S922_23020 [Salmonella enterica subsp. enterica]|nr:hypothetical protein [Salmonella enterica subsp. enterica]EAW9774282.1 hypothetical protein [Salmonella enterica]